MICFRQFIAVFIILLFISPVFASEINQTISIEKPLVISMPPDETVYNIPSIIDDYSYNEMAVNAIKNHITLFTEKIKKKFSLWLKRSGKYMELMRNILTENNVPEEIVFIPLIESGFSANAYSPARAVGYWQFIASTAKRYGLEISWWKDERKDPVKSTKAAANYLKDLYEMFGSWNLAMAAYNAGEGKILKALNRTKAEDYWSLLDTNYIKAETKNYVPKFIAASMIANRPEDFGFENLEYYPPLNYDEVLINHPLDLDVAAECAGTSLKEIKELNPELRRWCTPPDVSEYTLRIPAGTKDLFIKNLAKVPEEKRFTIDKYTVKKGDTFKKISKKTGIPVQVILDLNDLEKIIPLKAGMKLYLPPKGKFELDRDDKIIKKNKSIKKASYKYKKKKHKSRKRRI